MLQAALGAAWPARGPTWSTWASCRRRPWPGCRPSGTCRPWSSRPPTTPLATTASSSSAPAAPSSAEERRAGHRGRARTGSSTRRSRAPARSRDTGWGPCAPSPVSATAYVELPGGHARRPPAGRPPGGGGQRQRQRLGPGRRRLRAAGRRGGGHRVRPGRHQHQRRLRVDVHRTAEPGGGRARCRPRTGPGRRRRPAAGGGRDRRPGRRRRAAGPVRPRPGRPRASWPATPSWSR